MKNLDQKLKISNNTQNFIQIYSLESLLNTSLHHAMKITYFNFFWISSLFFRGLTPLKLKNFHQKLKISKNNIFFAQHSSWECLITASLLHAMKIKHFIYFWILSLFSWANTFKTQEFRPKVENFQQHSKLCTTLFLRKFN